MYSSVGRVKYLDTILDKCSFFGFSFLKIDTFLPSRISEALASLKWHQYVRSKQEIRAELKVILAKCKTCFSNVGMGFNYHIGSRHFSKLILF